MTTQIRRSVDLHEHTRCLVWVHM